MSVPRPALLFISILLLSPGLAAQQAPQRDPQAIAVVTQAIAAMGGVVPTDSVATGTVVIVAGSTTEQGTIRILTRGIDQSAEQIQTPSATRTVIYSRMLANEIQGTVLKRQLELAVTSHSPNFPLPLLAGALNNPDVAFQYVGLETLSGAPVQHIRFWNTFSSRAQWQPLADLSRKDVWIDAASNLPKRLSYERREARGASPRIPMDIYFSNYRNVGGVLYPATVQKLKNGTPWATITIQTVAFNTGLTDANFPVQ